MAWRWHTALPGRRSIRPQQASWDVMGVAAPTRSAAERRRLVRMLSDRRDWAGLLRLAMGLPVCDAVVVRRWFPPRWQPADERDRHVYSLLAQVRPPVLASAYELLRNSSCRLIRVGGGNPCWPQVHAEPVRLVQAPTAYKRLLELTDRPQAQWTPADLGYVRGARSLAQEQAGILPLYDLVVACMQWRFAADVTPALPARSSKHA